MNLFFFEIMSSINVSKARLIQASWETYVKSLCTCIVRCTHTDRELVENAIFTHTHTRAHARPLTHTHKTPHTHAHAHSARAQRRMENNRTAVAAEGFRPPAPCFLFRYRRRRSCAVAAAAAARRRRRRCRCRRRSAQTPLPQLGPRRVRQTQFRHGGSRTFDSPRTHRDVFTFYTTTNTTATNHHPQHTHTHTTRSVQLSGIFNFIRIFRFRVSLHPTSSFVIIILLFFFSRFRFVWKKKKNK